MSLLITWMRKTVTRYLFTPIRKVESFSKPYALLDLCCDRVKRSSFFDSLPTADIKLLANIRSESYRLQAVRLGRVRKKCKRVLIFIKGMGNHLFFNNKRFEEILDNMGNDAIGYSCNPYGVYNNPETLQPCAYTPQSISLDDVVEDYRCLVSAVLAQHPGATLTIVGHSAGGLYAKMLALKIANTPIAKRLRCLYTSVSFNSVVDFVDKLSIEDMLQSQQRAQYCMVSMLSSMRIISDKILKWGVKFAIMRAQWGARCENLERYFPPGCVYQANLMPKFDAMIGDLASVVRDGPYQKLLVPLDQAIDEGHSLPPSQLKLLSGESELSFIKRLLARAYAGAETEGQI